MHQQETKGNVQDKGWSFDWMSRNPTNGLSWELRDENTQRRMLGVLNKAKPSYVIVKPVDGHEAEVSTNNFLSEICRIQLKQGRTFVNVQSLKVPLAQCGNLSSLSKMNNVHQIIRHMTSGTQRIVTNSSTVIETISTMHNSENLFTAIQGGLEVQSMARQQVQPGSLHSLDNGGVHEENEASGYF